MWSVESRRATDTARCVEKQIMERFRTSARILQALIFAILLLGTVPAAAGAEAELIRTFSAEDFRHSELHEDSPDAREAQRCFKVVEDEPR